MEQDLLSMFNIEVEEKEITTKKKDSNVSKSKEISKSSNHLGDLENYKKEIIIKAYDNELFRVPGPIRKEDWDSILNTVRTEYGLPEFRKERTMHSFDKELGILCLDIKFQKKG